MESENSTSEIGSTSITIVNNSDYSCGEESYERITVSETVGSEESGSFFGSTSGYFNKYPNFPTFMSLSGPAYGVMSPSLNFLPEPVNIRSSSNGLLLCQGQSCKYYVCNPATRKFQCIPFPEFYHGEPSRAVLAFEPSDDRNIETSYFVVCPFTFPKAKSAYFETYSSVTRTWRLRHPKCIKHFGSGLKDNGFYANGTSYWETLDGVLMMLDMKDEIFSVESLPAGRVPGGTLSFLDGELCYVTACFDARNTCVINIHRAVDMSLKRVVNVEVPLLLRGDGEQCQVLPCVNDDSLCCIVGTGAFACSLKDGSVTLIRKDGIESGAEYVPYVNSLVPLEESRSKRREKGEDRKILLRKPSILASAAERAAPPQRPMPLTEEEERNLESQMFLAAEKALAKRYRETIGKIGMSGFLKRLGFGLGYPITPQQRYQLKFVRIILDNDPDNPSTAPPPKNTRVSVYMINDLSHPEIRHKVHFKALDYRLYGCAVITDNNICVVVAGGKEKYVEKYKKLMLKCIRWADPRPYSNQPQKKGVNKCVLLREETVVKPSFKRFKFHKCKTLADARQVFFDAGVTEYWDLALKNYYSSSSREEL